MTVSMQLYVIAAKTLTASGTARLIASKSHRFPLNAGIVVNQLEGVLRKIQAAAKHCGELLINEFIPRRL